MHNSLLLSYDYYSTINKKCKSSKKKSAADDPLRLPFYSVTSKATPSFWIW